GALERRRFAERELFLVVDVLRVDVLGLGRPAGLFVVAVAIEEVRVGELVTLGAPRRVEEHRRRSLRRRLLLVRVAFRTEDGRLLQVVELRSATEAFVFLSEIRHSKPSKTARTIASGPGAVNAF